jgi:hypothetical protein
VHDRGAEPAGEGASERCDVERKDRRPRRAHEAWEVHRHDVLARRIGDGRRDAHHTARRAHFEAVDRSDDLARATVTNEPAAEAGLEHPCLTEALRERAFEVRRAGDRSICGPGDEGLRAVREDREEHLVAALAIAPVERLEEGFATISFVEKRCLPRERFGHARRIPHAVDHHEREVEEEPAHDATTRRASPVRAQSAK